MERITVEKLIEAIQKVDRAPWAQDVNPLPVTFIVERPGREDTFEFDGVVYDDGTIWIYIKEGQFKVSG